jgi:hypothetical protein
MRPATLALLPYAAPGCRTALLPAAAPAGGGAPARNPANQESDSDPDPAASADGKAPQEELLRAVGILAGPGRR